MIPAFARRRTGKPAASAGPTYALDGVTGDVLACSFRRLRSDYLGPLARLRRDSDGATFDVTFDGEDAEVSLVQAWLGAANATLNRWHVQDGSGLYLVQNNNSLQPGVEIVEGKLRIAKTAAQWMALPSSLTLTNSALFFVGQHVSTALFYNVIIGDIMAYRYFFLDSTVVGQNVGCSGGLLGPIRGANDSITTFSQFTISQADYVRVNGSSLTLTAENTPALNSLTRFGDGGGVNGAFNSSELILFSTKPSDGVRDALESSQRAHWGTP